MSSTGIGLRIYPHEIGNADPGNEPLSPSLESNGIPETGGVHTNAFGKELYHALGMHKRDNEMKI